MRSEFFLVFVIIVLFTGLSIFPTLYHQRNAPAGTEFSLAFNYFPDYYHYISWMRDGKDGHLDITTRFTSESFPRKYVYVLYPLLGRLAGMLGLSLFHTYFWARIIFGVIRLVLVYEIIRLLINDKKRKVTAFLFTVAMPSFVRMGVSDGQLSWGFFLNGITNFDVFRRVAFIPHHLLSHIFNILYFLLLYKSLKENRKLLSLLAGVFLFLASMLNPATILYMAFINSIAIALLWLVMDRGKFFLVLSHFVLSSLPVLLAVAYYKFYLFTGFPWDNFGEDPKGMAHTSLLNNVWTLPDYLAALGPALLCSLIALTRRPFKKHILYILLLAWASGPILAFILFSQFFNSSLFVFRLFQAQQFIPLGILGALGVFHLLDRFKHAFVRALILTVLIVVSLPYYSVSLRREIEEITPAYYNVYIPVESLQAFDFLETHTPPESVVLTGYYFGELLPAYTHNKVYKGKPDLTYDYENKLRLFTKFFNNQMTEEEADAFMKSGRISYVLFGPDTPPPYTIVSKLKMMKLIYQSGNNYVYQIL